MNCASHLTETLELIRIKFLSLIFQNSPGMSLTKKMFVKTLHTRKKGNSEVSEIVLDSNRPFPSCLLPQFQNESLYKTIQVKMPLICMKMDMKVIHIIILMVLHVDSF